MTIADKTTVQRDSAPLHPVRVLRTASRRALSGGAAFLAILFGTALVVIGAASQVPSGTWGPAGGQLAERAGASAVLLADGRVLIAGGRTAEQVTSSCEIVGEDGLFSDAAPMQNARTGHAALLLRDGRVFVVGGTGPDGEALDSAEVF